MEVIIIIHFFIEQKLHFHSDQKLKHNPQSISLDQKQKGTSFVWEFLLGSYIINWYSREQ